MSPIASVKSAIVLAEFPDGRQALFVDIAIDCPVCGSHVVRFAGHHMREIRDIAIEAMDRYPELTGTPPVKVLTDAFTIAGGGGDPTEN